jgi:hypothetical protein
MCANDQPLFFAKEGRGTPLHWLISDRNDVFDPIAPSCRGLLFHGKRRFWLQIPGTADCEFGLSFYDIPGLRVTRAFRVVVAKGRPYTAESKELELARIAKQGTGDAEKFVNYASKQPEKNEKGKMILRFGDVFVVSSVKNFIVEQEDGQPLFMIYRSSSATCTVKAWAPLTPLVAFAWAVAIVTTAN